MRARCPSCFRPTGVDTTDGVEEIEEAAYLHSVSGNCAAKPKQKPISTKGKSR